MPASPVASRLIRAVIFLFLAASFGAEAQSVPDFKPGSGVDYCSEVERETFSLVNQYRKASDLPPLAWDGEIAKAARAHSRDMATGEVDFGHDGFSDRITRLRAVLPGLWGAGENVLFTSNLDRVAQNAVTMWLHSPHHLKNIRGDYNYSGLGVWQKQDGTIYFTQIFVKIKPPSPEAQEEPSSVGTPFGMLASPETRPAR